MAPRHLVNKLPSIQTTFLTGDFAVTSASYKDSKREREREISNSAGYKRDFRRYFWFNNSPQSNSM